MRRVLAASLVVLALAGATACQPPAEPAMTIYATSQPQPECESIQGITGTVTPGGATPRVVLQQSVSGKWQDWTGYSQHGGQPHLLAANVSSTGTYRINYMVPRTTNTRKLRIRSNGGTRFSPTFYITPWSAQPGRCG